MTERRFSENEPIMVSIRCITYNHAPFIRQCLEGFIMQKTNFRYQAVVHDDASTDGTTDIVREYAEKYPDIIVPMYEEENRWSKKDGSLLTIMYPLLIGKYLAHCEGDDFWTDPYKLQKQVDFLESHSDYVLTYTDYSVVDGASNQVSSNKPKRFSGDCTRNLILEGNFICTPTSLYRRCYDNNWPDLLFNLPFHAKQSDYIHWIFLSSKGKFKFINDNTATYRLLTHSASHFDDFNKSKSFFTDAQKIRFYFNNEYNVGVSVDDIEKSYCLDCIRAAMNYEKDVLMNELKAGIKKHPSIILKPKLWVLSFIRVVLNKKI